MIHRGFGLIFWSVCALFCILVSNVRERPWGPQKRPSKGRTKGLVDREMGAIFYVWFEARQVLGFGKEVEGKALNS